MIFASFAGNLGQDAKLRDGAGTPVVGFSVAVTIGYGEKQSTQWVNCSLWGKRAEALSQYLVKGKQVTVWGEVSLRTYDGKNGPATSMECRVHEVKLHKGADEGGGERRGLSGRPDEWKGSGQAQTAGAASDFDDSLPF